MATHYDPYAIRPLKDMCIVLAEPRKEVMESGIIIPMETGEEKVTEGVGTIIRPGNGLKCFTMVLRPGMRVAYRSYLKYANHIQARQNWPDGRVKEYFFISADDLICEVEEGVELGVFSRPNNKVSDKRVM